MGAVAGDDSARPSGTDSSVDPGQGDGPVWPRALGLFALALALTVVSPGVLVGIPLVLLVLLLPTRSFGLMLVGGFAAFLAFQGVTRDGMWYVERGWAVLVGGGFVALTLRWPDRSFLGRALGAVAAGSVVTSGLLLAGSGRWEVLDWMMGSRIRSEVLTGLSIIRSGDEPLPESLVSGIYSMMELQVTLFPASLALASVASLGVAWWVYTSLSEGSDGGLAPLRRFRFHDQLVWLLIGGLALVLFGGGAWERAGWNALVFMGALYAMRGAAVAVFLAGGVSFVWALVLAAALLFLWPVMAVSAAVVGLGDTWLRVREKVEKAKDTTA